MRGARDKSDHIGVADGVDVAEAEACWKSKLVDEM